MQTNFISLVARATVLWRHGRPSRHSTMNGEVQDWTPRNPYKPGGCTRPVRKIAKLSFPKKDELCYRQYY